MKRTAIFIVGFLLIASSAFPKKPKAGIYRAVLLLNEAKGIEVPFNMEIRYKSKKTLILIRNADETIVVNEVALKGDSVIFKMPIFDTEFRTVLVGDSLEGLWINYYKTTNNKIKFKASFGDARRFLFTPGKPEPVFEGRWETTFSPGSKDSSKAIGVFHHLEQTDEISGTFLTETGDYRYLQGMKNGNNLYLSCFDGNHAYLFVATWSNNELKGDLYAGATGHETWIARRNDQFKLQDAESITFMKNPNEKLNFSFPDLDKKQVSLNDKEFQNKPVIIQIMGTWCPNCMDESVYFSQLYKEYKGQGLEIVALAFEKTTDFEQSKKQVERLKARLKLDYPILITQQSGREKASESLPQLNQITAFPTTIFLNRQHQVVKIHTGFSGPATGSEYTDYKQHTESLVRQLLKE